MSLGNPIYWVGQVYKKKRAMQMEREFSTFKKFNHKNTYLRGIFVYTIHSALIQIVPPES